MTNFFISGYYTVIVFAKRKKKYMKENVFRMFEATFTRNKHIRNFLINAMDRNVPVQKFVSKNGSKVYKTEQSATGHTRIMGLDPKGNLFSFVNKTIDAKGNILVNIFSGAKRDMTHIVNKDGKNIQLNVNSGSIKRTGIGPLYDSYENVNLIVKNSDGISKKQNPQLERRHFLDLYGRHAGTMYFPKP